MLSLSKHASAGDASNGWRETDETYEAALPKTRSKITSTFLVW